MVFTNCRCLGGGAVREAGMHTGTFGRARSMSEPEPFKEGKADDLEGGPAVAEERRQAAHFKALLQEKERARRNLVKADITVNKNMVPFDTRSPFVTSGIRIGTAAITTRGFKEADMINIVDLIDEVIMNYKMNGDWICKRKSKCDDGWQTFVCGFNVNLFIREFNQASNKLFRNKKSCFMRDFLFYRRSQVFKNVFIFFEIL